MNYNIKGTGLELTPEIREYIEKRFRNHADKFLAEDATAHADVELEHAPLRDGPKYRAEVTVAASGEVYRAEQWGAALHECIDLAMDGLSKELRRTKDKRKHVFRRGAQRFKEYIRGWRS